MLHSVSNNGVRIMAIKGHSKGYTLPVDVRFWRFVEPCEGCWEWKGNRNTTGYGQIRVGRKGPSYLAHRISYELHKGPIPDGKIVRHICDNPSCVNPDHLEVGTHKDNAQDCIDRGRRARRIRPHTRMRKLTDDQVRAIRADRRHAMLVAIDHGISEVTVYNIRARRRKALVPD